MDPRVQILKAAFRNQQGSGYEFPVYAGRGQYGQGLNIPVFAGRGMQYGAGFGDVMRGIWRFFRPILVRGASTLLKAGGEAIKDNSNVRGIIKDTLKPTLSAVLGATGEQVEKRFAEPSAAPPPKPPSEMVGAAGAGTQRGSGKRKSIYKRKKPAKRRLTFTQYQHPIIRNF